MHPFTKKSNNPQYLHYIINNVFNTLCKIKGKKRGKLVRRREEEKVEEREKENGEENSQADHPVIR